jgi:hypothetical protein
LKTGLAPKSARAARKYRVSGADLNRHRAAYEGRAEAPMSDSFKTFDNFRETHEQEEQFRAETMALIDADAAMRMRFALVEKGSSPRVAG